jgi:uncharacterized repeat protein (TIGR04076 family)
MNKQEAVVFFSRTVAQSFVADTPLAERPATEQMLADSRVFFERCAQYQVVAEIVESKRCMAGLKVGDRYVIQGAHLDPKQTTWPYCIFFISMLVQRVSVAFDRFDREETFPLTLPGAQCTDPGPVVGGFGGVKARLWIESLKQEEDVGHLLFQNQMGAS